MTLPRVLLVEDDTSIARFVQMALDELPIELVICTNVPDAMQALHTDSVRLIITDLMLPGESGIDLVQQLLNDPALGGKVPVAVFSAGLTPAVREQMMAMKVWRLLSKPASVLDLEACVRDALHLNTDQPARTPATETETATADSISANSAETDEAQAIATHFAGDAFLFKAYRDSCLHQFHADVKLGDAACAAQDWPALRRLAHSLATVLLTLGHPSASVRAQQLETSASHLVAEQCVEHWLELRAFLARL
ncbi:MAG: response regulator [Acidovorax sp.]|nr:response regulator [Acidovorax sp.]